MRFSLRQLEVFRLFAAHLSVTETARLTHVSQSAASHSLRELEAAFGVKLFFRVGNRLRLTREGIALLPAIDRVFAQLSHLETEAESMRSIGAGHLTVATMPPIGTWLINATVARFLVARPKLRFSLQNAAASQVLEQVRTEVADLGLTIAGGDDTGVQILPLLHGEIVCVLPSHHRLRAKRHVAIADLGDERLISPGPNTEVGAAIRTVLPEHRRRLDALEINQSAVALDLVARGVGVALIHPFGLPRDGEKVCLRRFRPTIALSISIVLPRARPMSPLISSFIDEIRQTAAEAVAGPRRILPVLTISQ